MKNIAITILLGATIAAPAWAQQAATAKAGALANGEVRRIDKDAKKLTIRHGPIQNLDMPAMTMLFQVKDPAMLDKVNTGDKIRFSAEKTGGAFTVTSIEVVR